jgi:LPS sulfotransferase NodH
MMFEGVTRSYTIAFTVRSGSNAICDLLERNELGAPNEWFQAPPVSNEGEPWLNAFARIIDERQAGGVFGSKMSHDHRAALDECLRKAILGYRRLEDVLPCHRWVQLVRKDKILQAISCCRAETSSQWSRTEADHGAPDEFEYDFLHVLSRLMMIQGGEFAWDVYFRQHHIEPLVIVYEDFFQDLERQLSRLIDYLGGLPPGHASIDMGQRFRIQREEASYVLRERFILDLNRIGETSLVKEIGEPWDRWLRFFTERQWRLPHDAV